MTKALFSTADIVNAYEENRHALSHFFAALREAKKHGFRMCQYKYDGSTTKKINAAIFCLSLCNRESILLKANTDDVQFRATLVEAVERSPLLKRHVEFLLYESPAIEFNFGHCPP